MKTLIATASGLLVASGFAAAAQAGGINPDTAKMEASDTRVVQTLDADGQVGQLTIVRIDNDAHKTAVLGAFEQQGTDAYIVEDKNGDLYINHLVPLADLPDPHLEVKTEQTYTIEHRGITFTNKIIDQG